RGDPAAARAEPANASAGPPLAADEVLVAAVGAHLGHRVDGRAGLVAARAEAGRQPDGGTRPEVADDVAAVQHLTDLVAVRHVDRHVVAAQRGLARRADREAVPVAGLMDRRRHPEALLADRLDADLRDDAHALDPGEQ